jgi:tetratricopeptide (TPR) repeat protein
VVLGLGAAAIFGYRSSQEFREELNKELEKVTDAREKMEALHQRVQEERNEVEKLRGELSNLTPNLVPIFVDLLQASQELSLKNYQEAYRFVTNVLRQDPYNIQALYVAGWLELQYIPGKLTDGLTHLESAMQRDPDSLSIQAAYGVGLRRKALQTTPPDERQALFDKAEKQLTQALEKNPNLIDLNRESFWGPVGGIQRDTNRIDEAIKSYERALQVTPGSSYPMGNLATLYLQRAYQQPDDPALLEKALGAFERVDEFARAELAFMPKDYFLMMDLAMANAILGVRDPHYFQVSAEWLQAALLMDSSQGMLSVSLKGWQRLDNFCPDHWVEVKQHLDTAIRQIQETILNKA